MSLQIHAPSPENKMIFSVHARLFAVPVAEVAKVYRAMQITALPDAPPMLLGVVNLGGRMLPVVDLRSRLELPAKPIDPDDRLVLLTEERTGQRPCCFFVDQVMGVVAFAQEEALEPQQIHPHLAHALSGVGKYQGETVLLLNIRELFSHVMEDARPLLDENRLVPRESHTGTPECTGSG